MPFFWLAKLHPGLDHINHPKPIMVLGIAEPPSGHLQAGQLTGQQYQDNAWGVGPIILGKLSWGWPLCVGETCHF